MAEDLTSKFVSNRAWNRYDGIISNFLDTDAGRKKIVWVNNITQPLPFGEDEGFKYYGIPLEVLCFYNSFRNWPINQPSVSGTIDDENLTIYISKTQLTDYLDENGYFKFDGTQDRFVISGQVYKPSGDTEISQAKNKTLCFMIILERDRQTKLNNDNVMMQNTPLNYTDYLKSI